MTRQPSDDNTHRIMDRNHHMGEETHSYQPLQKKKKKPLKKTEQDAQRRLMHKVVSSPEAKPVFLDVQPSPEVCTFLCAEPPSSVFASCRSVLKICSRSPDWPATGRDGVVRRWPDETSGALQSDRTRLSLRPYRVVPCCTPLAWARNLGQRSDYRDLFRSST